MPNRAGIRTEGLGSSVVEPSLSMCKALDLIPSTTHTQVETRSSEESELLYFFWAAQKRKGTSGQFLDNRNILQVFAET
jgi:hypothetical protein